LDLSFQRYYDFYISAFWLEIPYSFQGHFWGFWGHIPANDVTHRPNPERTSLLRLSHALSVKIGSAIRPGRVPEKKVRTVKKVTKW